MRIVQNNNKRTNEFSYSFGYVLRPKVWSAGSWLFFSSSSGEISKKETLCKFVHTHHARTPNDYRRTSSTAICRHSRIIGKKRNINPTTHFIKSKFPTKDEPRQIESKCGVKLFRLVIITWPIHTSYNNNIDNNQQEDFSRWKKGFLLGTSWRNNTRDLLIAGSNLLPD